MTRIGACGPASPGEREEVWRGRAGHPFEGWDVGNGRERIRNSTRGFGDCDEQTVREQGRDWGEEGSSYQG